MTGRPPSPSERVAVMPQARRLMLVSLVDPYPTDVGKKVVLAGMLHLLAPMLAPGGLVLVHVGVASDSKPPAGVRRVTVRPPTAPARMVRALRSLFTDQSLQEAMATTDGQRRRIAELILEHDPDVVVLDTIRLGRLFLDPRRRPGRRRRWVLFMDDLFSLRYRRLREGMGRGEDFSGVLGGFADKVPRMLHALVSFKPALQLLLRWEERRVAHSERRQAAAYDAAVLLNAQEAVRLRSQAPSAQIETLPPVRAVPVRGAERRWAGEPRFVILGNLGYSPNDAGLRAFVELALPNIRRDLPEAVIRVVGAGASDGLTAYLAQRAPDLDLAGFVPDLDGELASCAAIIAPVTTGSGIKIKAIDALASGAPLITTAAGVRGIDVKDGEHCLIEDDMAQFALAMRRTLDPQLNASLSGSASALYQAVYSYDAGAPLYRRILLGD